MPFALMESRLWHPELDPAVADEEWEVPEQLTRSQRLSQLKSGLKPPRPKTAPGGGRRAAKQRSEPELTFSGLRKNRRRPASSAANSRRRRPGSRDGMSSSMGASASRGGSSVSASPARRSNRSRRSRRRPPAPQPEPEPPEGGWETAEQEEQEEPLDPEELPEVVDDDAELTRLSDPSELLDAAPPPQSAEKSLALDLDKVPQEEELSEERSPPTDDENLPTFAVRDEELEGGLARQRSVIHSPHLTEWSIARPYSAPPTKQSDASPKYNSLVSDADSAEDSAFWSNFDPTGEGLRTSKLRGQLNAAGAKNEFGFDETMETGERTEFFDLFRHQKKHQQEGDSRALNAGLGLKLTPRGSLATADDRGASDDPRQAYLDLCCKGGIVPMPLIRNCSRKRPVARTGSALRRSNNPATNILEGGGMLAPRGVSHLDLSNRLIAEQAWPTKRPGDGNHPDTPWSRDGTSQTAPRSRVAVMAQTLQAHSMNLQSIDASKNKFDAELQAYVARADQVLQGPVKHMTRGVHGKPMGFSKDLSERSDSPSGRTSPTAQTAEARKRAEKRKEVETARLHRCNSLGADRPMQNLEGLISALANQQQLQSLNLADNRIGLHGAQKLADVLSEPTCQISTLVLAGNRFGDQAAIALAGPLGNAPALTQLDLRDCAIGCPGVSELADYLAVNDSIQMLDLSWNRIRSKGGIAVAKCLSENQTLTDLDLSWNGIGQKETVDNLMDGGSDVRQPGAEEMGGAIADNTVLVRLDLGHNRIEATGAFVIADGMDRNMTLRNLIMDGNPIGMAGGREMLRAIRELDKTRNISLKDCNIKQTDQKLVTFDPTAPSGDYSLDISKNFDQAVVTQLMKVVKGSGGRDRWTKLSLELRFRTLKSPICPNKRCRNGCHHCMRPTYWSPNTSRFVDEKQPPDFEARGKDLNETMRDSVCEKGPTKIPEICALIEGMLNKGHTAECPECDTHGPAVSTPCTHCNGWDSSWGNLSQWLDDEGEIHTTCRLRFTHVHIDTQASEDDCVSQDALDKLKKIIRDTRKGADTKEQLKEVPATVPKGKKGGEKGEKGVMDVIILEEGTKVYDYAIPEGLKEGAEFFAKIDFSEQAKAVRRADHARREKRSLRSVVRNLTGMIEGGGLPFHMVVKMKVEKEKKAKELEAQLEAQRIASEKLNDFMASSITEDEKKQQRAILDMSAKEFYFNAEQVDELLDLFTDQQAKAEAVIKLFERVLDTENLLQIVETKMDKEQRDRIERQLGPLYRFDRKNPTGHYRLDLSERFQHMLATQLTQLSNSENEERLNAGFIDTSQRLNRYSLRNQTIDKKTNNRKWDGTSDDSELPETGIFEFDYASTYLNGTPRPYAKARVIPGNRFDEFIEDVKPVLLSDSTPLKKGEYLRKKARGRYFTSKQVCRILHTADIVPCYCYCMYCWDNVDLEDKPIVPERPFSLPERKEDDSSPQGGRKKKKKKKGQDKGEEEEEYEKQLCNRVFLPCQHMIACDKCTAKIQPKFHKCRYCDAIIEECVEVEDDRIIEHDHSRPRAEREFRKVDSDGGGFLDRQEIETLISGMLGNKTTQEDIDKALASMDEDGTGEVDMEEFCAWFKREHSDEHPAGPDVFLVKDRLAEMVRRGSLPRPSAGDRQLAEELVVTLFGRTVDMLQFKKVLHFFSNKERNNVYQRLGPLNAMNPMDPDGWWQINLSTKDERAVTKMLVYLALAEPGENWLGERFGERVERISDAWELPKSWTDDECEGTPNKGFLEMTYFTSAKQVRLDMRRSLIKRCLVNEEISDLSELGDPFALMAAAKEKKAGAAGGASPLSNILGNLKKK